MFLYLFSAISAMVKMTSLRFERKGGKVKGSKALLGPLETELMDLLWAGGECTVRDLHSKLGGKAVLTSVAVTLDRLYDKKLVKRKTKIARGGHYYLYFAASSREGFHHQVLETTVNKLIASFGPSAVTYFNERFRNK